MKITIPVACKIGKMTKGVRHKNETEMKVIDRNVLTDTYVIRVQIKSED